MGCTHYIVGKVHDQFGKPVEGAQIQIQESRTIIYSTKTGAFRGPSEKYHRTKQRITVRFLGYQPIILDKYLWKWRTDLGILILQPEEIQVPYQDMNIDPSPYK